MLNTNMKQIIIIFLTILIADVVLANSKIHSVENRVAKTTISKYFVRIVPKTNDNTFGKWLSIRGFIVPSSYPQVYQFLKPLCGSMHLLGCIYDGSKLLDSKSFQNNELRATGSKWNCKLKCFLVSGEKDAMDLNLISCFLP